jgi:alkylation response protein AidB-like acyl-CoA dehydrogenase
MDIFFDQDHLTLRSQVRSWVEKNLISARVNETDIEREAQKLVTQLSKEGFTAYVAAKRYGGVRESVQERAAPTAASSKSAAPSPTSKARKTSSPLIF